MPEEVLFENEGRQSREEIASHLRLIANKLDAGEDLTLKAGDQSVTMAVPPRPTFEVKAEREGPADGPGELSVELEIEWDEEGGTDDVSGGAFEIE